MSHRRLDRVADRLTQAEGAPMSDIDRAIYREIEELKRAFPDTHEQILAEIIEECRPDRNPDMSGQSRT